MYISAVDAARADLYTPAENLKGKYPEAIVAKLIRLRDLHQWMLANPESRDRQFVDVVTSRYGVSRRTAYDDLAVLKTLLPELGKSSAEFHRWRFNEMIIDTFQMAKRRKDTRTMERAAASYARYNRIDAEAKQLPEYEKIVPQPFTPVDDPSVLGIKPIPDIREKIKRMIDELSVKSSDIEDIQYELPDIQDVIFEDIGQNCSANSETSDPLDDYIL